jgi:hypothetical protein
MAANQAIATSAPSRNGRGTDRRLRDAPSERKAPDKRKRSQRQHYVKRNIVSSVALLILGSGTSNTSTMAAWSPG